MSKIWFEVMIRMLELAAAADNRLAEQWTPPADLTTNETGVLRNHERLS